MSKKRKIGFGNWFTEKGKPFERNIIKIQKPEESFVRVIVTEGIYDPYKKVKTGTRKIRINVSQIDHYSKSNMYGKKDVKTCIMMDSESIHVEETETQVDKMIDDAIQADRVEMAKLMKKDDILV